jgi:hypothetical protein
MEDVYVLKEIGYRAREERNERRSLRIFISRIRVEKKNFGVEMNDNDH